MRVFLNGGDGKAKTTNTQISWDDGSVDNFESTLRYEKASVFTVAVKLNGKTVWEDPEFSKSGYRIIKLIK